MDVLVADPNSAQQMGIRSRVAIIERYNWKFEANAMLGFYATRLGVPRHNTSLHVHVG